MRRTIGYRFGGTEESYLVPITTDDDDLEISKKLQYIQDHPDATEQHRRLSRMSELECGIFDNDPEGIYK